MTTIMLSKKSNKVIRIYKLFWLKIGKINRKVSNSKVKNFMFKNRKKRIRINLTITIMTNTNFNNYSLRSNNNKKMDTKMMVTVIMMRAKKSRR